MVLGAILAKPRLIKLDLRWLEAETSYYKKLFIKKQAILVSGLRCPYFSRKEKIDINSKKARWSLKSSSFMDLLGLVLDFLGVPFIIG